MYGSNQNIFPQNLLKLWNFLPQSTAYTKPKQVHNPPPCTDSQQEDSLGLASTKIQLQHQEIPKPRVIGMIPGGSITIFLPCSYPLPQYRYWPKDPGVYGCFISLTTCDLEMLKETNTIQCTLKDKGLDHLF